VNRTAKMTVLGFILSWVIGSVSAAQTHENLVTNPGFEEGDKGWKYYDHTDGQSKHVIVPEGRDGKNAAKLSLRIGPTGDNGCLEQSAPCKSVAGKRLRLSVWAKCLDEKIGYNLAYAMEMPSQAFHWIKPSEWRGDWAQYATIFDSAADTTGIYVGVYIRHTGELWADDFSLAEAPGAELSTEAQAQPEVEPQPAPAPPQPTVPKSGAAAPAQREEVTRFFKEHPNKIDFESREDRLLFANRQIGLEFQRVGEPGRQGFRTTRVYGIKDGQDFLLSDPAANLPGLFQIVLDVDPSLRKRVKRSAFTVGSLCAQSTSFSHTGDENESVLHLAWKGIDLADEKGMADMEVTVRLRADDPFSCWRFSLKNRSITYGVSNVRFPVLNVAPIGESKDNVFIYPRDRGRLVEDPFRKEPGYGEGMHENRGRYPGDLTMQFEALYNKSSGVGLFFEIPDPVPNRKNMEAPNYPTHIAWRPNHYPPDPGFGDRNYDLPYDCVVGPFRGDWWDACRIYRDWALKQPWCRKGPLAARRDIPKWFKEAPLFLVTNSWADDENVAKSVAHALKYLQFAGVPLPINWYSWKEHHTEMTVYDAPYSHYRVGYQDKRPCSNIHDGNYPKLPALPSFAAACKELRKAGGMVNAYICLQIYDQGPLGNSPYAVGAELAASRDLSGEILNYSENEPVWLMCAWSPWWRDRLRETCVTMLKRENVEGFYLDIMNGLAEPCEWTPHGHSAFGGSSPTVGIHGLSEHIYKGVKETDPEAVTTGEKPGESMIDVTDGALYEFTLTPYCVAPLFAAVYNDYFLRYGMSVVAGKGDVFFLQAGSLFVEGAQVGRLAVEPWGGALSFDDPEHKDMVDFLGRLVGYYRQDLPKKFLRYGQLMRLLTFRSPEPMPRVSVSPDAVPSWEGVAELPALLSGVFRSQEGELGIFIVNISNEEISFASEMELARHGMTSATAKVETVSPTGEVKVYGAGTGGRVTLQGTLPPRHVTMFRVTATRN